MSELQLDKQQILAAFKRMPGLLAKQGFRGVVGIGVVGGAHLVLEEMADYTHDVDVYVPPSLAEAANGRLLEVVYQIGDSIQDRDWLNDDVSEFLPLVGPIPAFTLWKSFTRAFGRGPKVEINLPPLGYNLALKLLTARHVDEGNILRMMGQLNVETRAQAQEILDTYVYSDAQDGYGVQFNLDWIFN